MRILENANFNFIGNRSKAYIFSATVILVGLVFLLTRGLEVGIDFRGGSEFVISTEQEVEVAALRNALTPVLGAEPEVKRFDEDYLVRTTETGDMEGTQARVLNGVAQAFPGSQPTIVKSDAVGPRFADDLKKGAIYAVLGSLLVIFVYILIRFEWRFGLGAIVALFHDVLFTLGLFAMLHHVLPFSLQIDQAIIAAFLTIVGYSINDTVIVFDRVREYMNIHKTGRFETVVNDAINATLSRTIITSGTTLLAVLVLFILGGDVLRGFAFAIIAGIGIGTYSSVFIAAPVVVELRNRLQPGPAKR